MKAAQTARKAQTARSTGAGYGNSPFYTDGGDGQSNTMSFSTALSNAHMQDSFPPQTGDTSNARVSVEFDNYMPEPTTTTPHDGAVAAVSVPQLNIASMLRSTNTPEIPNFTGVETSEEKEATFRPASYNQLDKTRPSPSRPRTTNPQQTRSKSKSAREPRVRRYVF